MSMWFELLQYMVLGLLLAYPLARLWQWSRRRGWGAQRRWVYLRPCVLPSASTPPAAQAGEGSSAAAASDQPDPLLQRLPGEEGALR